MKNVTKLRTLLGLFLMIALLSPTAVLARGDGKKYFKEGLKHEVAEEWDKAAEMFTLAVNDNPKNPEYRLHLRRALFNASQMYMQKGRTLAQERDFEGAYIAFRKAYAYDPVNELAKSEMARMVRLQEAVQKGGNPDPSSTGEVRIVPTGGTADDGFRMPQKLEKLRDVSFPSGVNLMVIVKELAKELDLNVLFESESRLDNRTVRIDLKSVTPAKALDYIFLQENLFFQRVGPRTILVANSQSRTKFQQLVLRTFYLANAAPKEVKAVIQAAIPVQPGRAQTIVLEDEATNSITVRDTAENIKLIEKLIGSLDKDRAEVVMDVAIYEVNKNDLLQFGNQLGTGGADGTLLNLGGVGLPFVRRGSTQPITGGMGFPNVDVSSIALGLPVSTIAALQSKNDTKLLASTQIHAFNNQDSSARIGQRVPVRTASFAPVNGSGGNNNNNVFGDVYNYEQVGLTLKFKPIVFPNQDVQVQMEIESKDVAGALTDQPVFTERTIKGTARVQNNKTLLLASVAQGVESKGRTGLPLLGLIPIIGRLFTAPTRDNRQVDLVIAVTPRVIRAPAILPEDEVERPTGSVAVPTSSSLEAMIIQEERDEYLASARRVSNTAQVQLPDQKAPEYVRTDAASAAAKPAAPATETTAVSADSGNLLIRPIDTSARTLDIAKTANTFAPVASTPVADTATGPVANSLSAKVMVEQLAAPLKAGQRVRIAVKAESSAAFRSAVLGLRLDEKAVVVRSVMYGDMFGPALANGVVQPYMNQNGRVFFSVAHPDGAVESNVGSLAILEIEALVDGVPALTLEREAMNFLSADGRNFAIVF
ncbi:MAG: secretin N-terminal domain-containing protein [Pyrinomonadaceae bacterium]|nr:secretin N-terminal domain-containing protein [Pyrinomonadaceae bacterium]